MKRSLRRRVKDLYQRPVQSLARVQRARLLGKHIVGITGSCGKTSAKDYTAAVLAVTLQGRKSYDTTNGAYSVACTVLATRQHHDFCVQEVGAFGPGSLDPLLGILRPTVGVITVIGNEHYGSFRGPDGVFLEKRKLIDCLPEGGVAVLNSDDAYLGQLADQIRVRVVRYGRGEAADVRASDVSARFPETLSFTVTCGGEQARVTTQLLGEHQLVPVLAALATGHALGVPLHAAVSAIEACRPPRSRMELVACADGVTFINDSYKAPFWTLGSVYTFMQEARASRKWLVLGSISDHSMSPRRLYRRIVDEALESCDRLVLIGRSTHHAATGSGRVHAFARVEEADAFLHTQLVGGDLVLVKGNNVGDHLVRLFLSRSGKVKCWKEDCGMAIDCRSCKFLER